MYNPEAIYLGAGLGAKADALHPRTPQESQAHQVGVRRSITAHSSGAYSMMQWTSVASPGRRVWGGGGPVRGGLRGAEEKIVRSGVAGTLGVRCGRGQPESGALLRIELRDEAGLPREVAARGLLVAVVPVVHEEQVVDAVGVGGQRRRGLERQAGGAPCGHAAFEQQRGMAIEFRHGGPG